MSNVEEKVEDLGNEMSKMRVSETRRKMLENENFKATLNTFAQEKKMEEMPKYSESKMLGNCK